VAAEASKAPARLIMQVHDELVLEVADEAVRTLVQQMRDHMAHAAELKVPLKVDVGIGRTGTRRIKRFSTQPRGPHPISAKKFQGR
jgi:DNA polymerase I-like protein with 3'-5' exonuclease and polymerase domains